MANIGNVRDKEVVGFLFLFATAALFVLRGIVSARVPLTGDEAYYWLWGKHLALGYHDHPPLVGWLTALTNFLPHSPFWIRLPALICGIAAAFFFYKAAEEIVENKSKAKLALIIFM